MPLSESFSRLDPKNDAVFKLLFTSSEPVLVALLTAVLHPPVPIKSAVVQNPELPKDFFDDKSSYLDVLVTLDDGTLLDVEMQCYRHSAFRERVLYYWASIFSGQLITGQGYDQLARVVSVLFLDYEEFRFPHFHEIFRLKGEVSKSDFSPWLEIHTIELGKVTPQEITEPSKHTALEKWCRFLSSDDPLEIGQLTKQDPLIAMAEERLAKISADPKARHIALERQRREAAHYITLGAARREGREEGLAEGEAKGERFLLQKQLTLKFGPLSEDRLKRLERASEAELHLWAERILSAVTLDEVLET